MHAASKAPFAELPSASRQVNAVAQHEAALHHVLEAGQPNRQHRGGGNTTRTKAAEVEERAGNANSRRGSIRNASGSRKGTSNGGRLSRGKRGRNDSTSESEFCEVTAVSSAGVLVYF
jgi:hypothetical protein